ncbi:MAG: hypothetical protein AABZ76_07345 [Pseudomonadota bacterium]
MLKKLGGAGVILFALTWVTVWGLHELDIIDRFRFTWEAFATLATGGLAVLGAMWIGYHQLAITKQQTLITERQVGIAGRQARIEMLNLQAQMYDRRIAVYRAIQDYMGLQWSDKLTPDSEVSKNFYVALEGSAFLFPEAVQQKIRVLHIAIRQQFAVRRTIYKLEKDNQEVGDHVQDKLDRLSDTISEAFEELTEMITRYMRIDEFEADTAE